MDNSSFLAGADPSSPDSYNMLQQRREIALRMMAQKRAYPKNIGEGLASIGENIGDAAMMRALLERTKTLDAQRAAEEGNAAKIAGVPPAGVAPAAASPTAGPRADIAPTSAPPTVVAAGVPTPEIPGIVRQNPDGSIAGNITAPTLPAGTPPAPPPPRSVSGMPGTPDQGARLASSFAAFQPPPSGPEQAADARFHDTVGMEGGDTGAYAYAPTASRSGDPSIMSDAAPITGISPAISQSVGDTVQSGRNGIVQTLNNRTAPAVPQGNPTSSAVTPPSLSLGSPPEAAANRPIVSDIAPAPVPGAQMAEVRGIKPPEAGAEPVPPAPQEPRRPVVENVPRAPSIADVAYDPRHLELKKRYDRAVVSGDPVTQQIYQNHMKPFEEARQSEYARRLLEFNKNLEYRNTERTAEAEFGRNKSERELRIQALEDERQQRARTEKISRQLGGIPQDVYIANLKKSSEDIAGIPAATASIKRAGELVDKMYHGPFADAETFLAKVMGSAGFPVDPKASATEQFKTAMAGVMAQARKGIVGPGAQSEAELALLQKSTAADAKLTPETIKATLEAAARLNVQTAINHQQKVRRFAGEDDPDRQGQVFGAFGLPTSAMTDLVPQASVNKLFQFSNDEKVLRDFDNTFHTPGLSRDVLRFRKPQ